MNESTARANGHQPIERLVDQDLVDRFKPLIAREIARQLATDPEPAWIRYARAAMGYLSMISLVVLALFAVTGVLR